MPETGKAARSKWNVLFTVGLGLFAATVMATALNVALPSIATAFDSTFAHVQWVVLSYFLTNVVLLPMIGRLGDMVGKRGLFAWGLAIFTAGSLLCGLAPSVGWLIALRVVQGLGSALITALGLAIITETFPAEERGRAIGIAGSTLSAGVVIGPPLGGLVIDALSWQWAFFAAVPFGLLALVASLAVIPASVAKGRQRFDVTGASLLFVGLLSTMLGLTSGQARGFADELVLALFTIGALVLAAFVWWESRAREPIIDLSMFRESLFTIGLVAGFATFVSIAGTILIMPFYLENVLGYSPREVGILMAIVPVALVVIAPIAGSLSDRLGTRPITTVGLAMLLVGYLLVGTLDEETSAAGFVLRFLFVGLGMATFQSPNNSAIMGAVERARLGVASGLLAMTRTFGVTAGVSVLGTLWAVRVAARAAHEQVSDATAAPVYAQVAGLQDMLLVVQAMILIALALSVWDQLRRWGRLGRADRLK